MSPVLSSSKPAGFPIRRRAPFSSASLFPVCPDRSPNTRTLELAPLSGPGSPFSEIVSDIVPFKSGADCPPPTPASCGQPLRNSQDFQKYSFASGHEGAPEHICIGTATDPYQPAEREYGVTRACLEELARHDGLSVSITTKSNLITRDIDVLQEISRRSRLYVDITVTTLRPRLARLLEPRAPRPGLRLGAIRKLRDAGISVGAMASPLVPGITDREGELEALAAAAKEAGAQWIASGVLFLMPSSAKQFLPFLREKFPRLVRQYESWYTHNAYAPEPYRQKVAARLASIKAKLGFTVRPWEQLRQPVAPAPQLSLAW